MNPRRVAVGAVTAVLALLALTAMHALPMVMGHSGAADGASVRVGASAALMPGMIAGHVDGMVMAGTGETGQAAAAAIHSTDRVPPHGHSLMHLCFAVLAVGLSLALIASFRRRPWQNVFRTHMEPVRAVLTRDTGPPSLAGLCLLRC